MSRREFKVDSISWKDGEVFTVITWSPEDACHEWCEDQDRNSGFVDGYPDNHELRVIADDGTETRHVVTTDFEPSFGIWDKTKRKP